MVDWMDIAALLFAFLGGLFISWLVHSGKLWGG
jgi:hypothetical protein